MDPKMVLDWAVNYGLGIVLSILIAIFFAKMLVYVFHENTKREERLAGIIENHIGQLTLSVSSMNQQLLGRESYFREMISSQQKEHVEHKEMIASLQALQQEIVRLR